MGLGRHAGPAVAGALALLITASASDREAHAAPPWVDRPDSLPGGNWAFDVGVGLRHVPAPPIDDTGAGVNAEIAVGLTSQVELGVRTGLRVGDGFEQGIQGDNYGRLFDRQTVYGAEGGQVLANPEVRVRGALLRVPLFEFALEGRLVAPFASGTDPGAVFGIPMALHLGSRVRLDLGAYLSVVSYPRDPDVGISVPLDIWIQVTQNLWLGPVMGVAYERVGDYRESSNFSLGFGLGYSITRFLDLKTMFLFSPPNGGVFGAGVGIQVRIE
jgi:hypothetical protein